MTDNPIAQQANAAVGARIHALCWARRISQRKLAAHLGIAQAGVSRRLRGVTPFDVGELFLVAQLLDVDVVELVNENGPATLSVSVPGPSHLLPRLDSNQQPSGYRSAQVSGCTRCGDRGCDWCRGLGWDGPAAVVDLATWRARRAS